jgi:predicted oxidoreductase
MIDHFILGTGAAGSFNRSISIKRFLQECLQEGVIAFDTAPLYGSGAMEALLGKILRNAPTRPEVMANTKFGLYPIIPSRRPEQYYFLNKFIQSTGRRIGIKGRVSLNEEHICNSAMESLERSICHFGKGRIDVFFAHEVPVNLLMAPNFLEFVRNAKHQGLFRRFGLGGYRSHYAGRASRELLNEVDVIQVESVKGVPPPVPPDWLGEIFLHGVLAPLRSAPTNALSPISLESCLEDAIVVQGASRLIIGTTQVRNLRRTINALKNIVLTSRAVDEQAVAAP